MTRWLYIWRQDIIAALLIVFCICFFFYPLFLPEPKLLVTPDFGRSDAWHFSFSTRYFLGESLQKNGLPLWNPLAGGGFPFFAEGQTGALFLPNLIVYKLFDIVTAYNVIYIVTFWLLGLGMYAWLRNTGISPFPSLFGGLTLAFSGNALAQLPHITLLQGFSLLPWVLTAILHFSKKQSFGNAIFFILIGSQQIFTGYTQAVFISYLFGIPYYFWLIRGQKPKIRPVVLFFPTLICILGLAAIQLFPSYEFLQQSTVPKGFSPSDAMYFSYPLKHLKTFLQPFLLGNPKLGTYPSFRQFNGSIFWENTGYIGILPFIFTISLLIIKRKKSNLIKVEFIILVLVASFFLMLGKYSPSYFIYSFWPFSLFRVPSRFIWTFVTMLLFLSAYGMASLWENTRLKFLQTIIIVLVVLHISSLYLTWFDYHLLVPAATWLTKPEAFLSIDTQFRTYTVGDATLHNQEFLSKGWQYSDPYFFFRNTLSPNSGMVWNISHEDAYAGRFLQRPESLDGLLQLEFHESEKYATPSALAQKILSMLSVGTVISTVPLHSELFNLTRTLNQGAAKIFIYKNPKTLPRTYLANHVATASTFNSALKKISEDSFEAGSWVLLEDTVDTSLSPIIRGTTTITSQSNRTISVHVQTEGASMLILTDTYYPGWQATLDGNPTQVYPANIRQMAIFVPTGLHEVVFFYNPKSFSLGLWVSIFTAGAIIFVGVALFLFARHRTFQKDL